MPTSFILYIFLFTISVIGFCFNTSTFRGFTLGKRHIIPIPLSAPVRLWLILVGLIGVISCILKPDYLPDVRVYQSYFYNEEYTYVETSFRYISEISPNFITLIVIYAILSISIKLFAIKELSPNVWISLCCYLSLPFVLHDMIQIRAAVASGLCLLSIKYIVERNLKIFALLILIAMFFHNSAIVFAPFYLLKRDSVYKPFYSLILPISLILFLMGLKIGYVVQYISIESVQRYLSYIGDERFQESTIGPIWFSRAFIAILCVLRIAKIQKQYPYACVVLKIWIFAIAAYVLFMDVPAMSGRISELLNITQILAFAMAPLALNSYKRILLTLFIFSIIIYYYITTFTGILYAPSI